MEAKIRDPDPRRVLVVVDDEIAMRTLLNDFFSNQGFLVRSFGSVESALRALGTMDLSKVAAILSDVRMTPLDGTELLRRARKCYERIPVILFTAAGPLGEKEKATQMGASLYLCQPFSLTELKQKLDGVISV